MTNAEYKTARRQLLKGAAAISAATVCFGLTGSKLWAAKEAGTIKKAIVPSVKLNNGLPMPILGFGTNTLNDAVGVQSVVDAISVGYRLIDTAFIYGNEKSVGEGIKKSGIDRKELFITSKLWIDDAGYEKTLKAFDTSIEKLGIDYLDLYLIHRPKGDVKGSWRAMEELYKAGKIKAIGVSNFEPKQIDELNTYAKIKPAINQIETNAFFQQESVYPYMKKSTTQMQAWSPFAAGRNGMFTNKHVAVIGEKYNKTNAQVYLRWQFQRGLVAIPRSSQKAHMVENLNIFDFELSDLDMKIIAALDVNTTQFPEWS